MPEHIPIPVDVARQISQKFRKGIVVIVAFDDVSEMTHTVTYGDSPLNKMVAANAGDVLTKAFGADPAMKRSYEDFRNDPKELMAARYRAACELLERHATGTHVSPHEARDFLRSIRDRAPK